jgi:hypothetical protein
MSRCIMLMRGEEKQWSVSYYMFKYIILFLNLFMCGQFKSRNSIAGFGSVAESQSGSQKRIDIDSVKRNAPTLHGSQARSEVSEMVYKKVRCPSTLARVN